MPYYQYLAADRGQNLCQILQIKQYPQLIIEVINGIQLKVIDVQIDYLANQTIELPVKQATVEGIYIFAITTDNFIYTYKISPDTRLLIQILKYQVTDIQISLDCIFVEPDLNYIYAGSQGSLIIYEFTNQISIKFISRVENKIEKIQTFCITKVDQFIYLSNYYSGLSIFNGEDLFNPTLITTLTLVGYQSTQVYVFQKERILYSNSEYDGVQIVDISNLYQDQSKFINSSQQSSLLLKVASGLVLNKFSITPDEKWLFLGVRSIGIQIFDISDASKKIKPVFIQLIKQFGNFSNLVFFGVNYRYFAVSTGNYLLVFQQTVPSENIDYVGLYRQNFSVNIETDENIDDNFNSCFVNNQYLVVSGSLKYQFYVYDLSLPYSYKLIVQSPFLLGEYVSNNIIKKCVLYHLPTRQYLIYAYSQKIFVYDTSSNNPQNQPKFDLIYTFTIDYVHQINQLISFNNEEYLIMCYSNFIITLDIKNIQEFKIIQSAEKLLLYTNDHSSIAVDHHNKFGVLTILNQAAVYFQLYSDFQIKFIDYVLLYGAFQVEYDKANRNLFFIADGISGVTIIDSSDITKPKVISTQYLNKLVIQLFQPLNMPNSLLVNQSQRSVIAVIDLSNLDKIKIVQSFSDGGEETRKCQIDEKNSILIVQHLTDIKVYYLEKQANILRESDFGSRPAVQLKNMFDFSNGINETNIKLAQSQQYALVGEETMIHFSPYQIQNQYQIQSLKVFQEPYEQQNIVPSWITLDTKNQHMYLNPSKDLFTGQNIILLFQLKIQILFQQTDFVIDSTTLNINSSESQLIYSSMIQYGLLNTDGCASQDQSPLDNFPDDFLKSMKQIDNKNDEEQLLLFIREKLINSTLFYFFSLKINRSLFLTPSQLTCQNNPAKLCYVQSIQSSVSLTIYLLNEISYFMNEKFEGILSQFYQNNTVLFLQGSPELINNYLIQNLSIYSNQTILSQHIQFDLSDSLDSDWSSQFTYQEVQFIWYKKNITNIQTFQEIYQEKYPNGLQVESKFELIFNLQEIFSYHSTLSLSIQGFFDLNCTLSLPKSCDGSWICFDGQQVLSGMASLDQYENSYTLYFRVTDGYEYHYEILEIEFSIYSTKQILKITAIISGILFILIIIYILRQRIHNIFFYKHYLHSSEYLYYSNDKIFFKKLFLRQSNWRTAVQLFNLLKECFKENELVKIEDFDEENQEQLSTFYLNYLNQSGDLNEEEFIQDCCSILEKNQNLFSKLKTQTLQNKYSEIREALISIFYKYALYSDSNSYYAYKLIKNHYMKKLKAINWYKNLVKEKKIIQQSISVATIQNLEESSSNTKDNTQKSSEENKESRISFSDLLINNEELKRCLNELKKQEKNKFGLDYDIKILQNSIKSDYLGFDYKFNLKNYKQCFGESLHISSQQIGEIICHKKDLGTILKNDLNSNNHRTNSFKQIMDNLNLGYRRYPIALSKIQDQKEVSDISYNIELESLTFKFDLENLSQGQYKIQIFNTQNYLIFQFSFLKLFSSLEQEFKRKFKMFTFSSSQNIFSKKRERKSQKSNIFQNPYQKRNSRQPLQIDLKNGSNLSIQSIIKNPNSRRNKNRNATLKFEDDFFSNNNNYDNKIDL